MRIKRNRVLVCGVALPLLAAIACAQRPAEQGGQQGEREPTVREFDRAIDEPVGAAVTLCQQDAEGCAPCEGVKLGLIVQGGEPVEASCHVRSADGRGCRNGSSTVAWTLEPFDAWRELGPLRLEIEAKGRGRSPEAYGAPGHPFSAVLTPEHNRLQSRFPERLDLPQGGETDWYYDVRLYRVATGEVYACSDPILIIKDPPI
jgi:hypothetical protein